MDSKTQIEIKTLMNRIQEDYKSLMIILEKEVNRLPDDLDLDHRLDIDTTNKSKEIITIKW